MEKEEREFKKRKAMREIRKQGSGDGEEGLN